jgi:hypothetical protein
MHSVWRAARKLDPSEIMSRTLVEFFLIGLEGIACKAASPIPSLVVLFVTKGDLRGGRALLEILTVCGKLAYKGNKLKRGRAAVR